MKEDINPPKVEDIAMAIIPEANEVGGEDWYVHFINLKNHHLESVLVRSNGYGLKGKEKVKTSELRHFLDVVPARTCMKVESIKDDVFGLSNQYWVSFFYDGKIFDRKYVFVPESIDKRNFVKVPIIEEMGVMIK